MLTKSTFLALIGSAMTLIVAPTGYAVAGVLASYQAAARSADPTYKPSVSEGLKFYQKDFNVSSQARSCSSCHNLKPTEPGSHVITGKSIAPMAPRISPNRFTDPEKIEKWFKRNCKEVVGRLCSPAEKSDFITYLSAQ